MRYPAPRSLKQALENLQEILRDLETRPNPAGDTPAHEHLKSMVLERIEYFQAVLSRQPGAGHSITSSAATTRMN
jgi:hypothetical protein